MPKFPPFVNNFVSTLIPGTTLALAPTLATAAEPSAAGSNVAAPAPSVREYHTNVGPLRLTFAGEHVTGRYRIAVKSPADEGTMQGTLQAGLLEATWSEPHSSGRIIIAFTEDFSRCFILYTSAKNPTHWQGEWVGVEAARLDTATAGLRARLRGDWK